MLDMPGLYRQAREVLVQEATGADGVAKVQALEAIAKTLGKSEGRVLAEALSDRSPAVRFAAAMAVGDAGYEPAKPKLLKMAADKNVEPNRIVLCGVIYALYQLSNKEYTHELGELAFDTEKEVRSSAVMVMSKLGEPSAIPLLEQLYSQEQDPTVRLRALEAMAELGDAKSVNMLEGYTKSQYMDERIDAIWAMARTPGPRSAFVLKQLMREQRQPPFVRVAAAGALGRLEECPPEGRELCLKALREPDKLLREHAKGRINRVQVESLRQIAARSLGWVGQGTALRPLKGQLDASHAGTRVAAAASLVRLLKDFAPAGMEPQQATEPIRPAGEAPAAQVPAARPPAPAAEPTIRVPPVPAPQVEPEAAPVDGPLPEPPTQPTRRRWVPGSRKRELYRAGGKD